MNEIKECQQAIVAFGQERNWQKYHTPKNLAASVAIEAAELLEIFQWLTPEESYQLKESPKEYEHLGEELADVFAYLLQLADSLEVDLYQVFQDKMIKNAKKYPASENHDFSMESK